MVELNRQLVAVHGGDVAVAEFLSKNAPAPCRSARVPLRLGQCLRHAARTPRADHLGGAFLTGRAVDGAIGARLAGAIGAAAIDIVALRELAAGLVAGALEALGAGLGQGDVPGERRAAERKDAG